MSISPQTMKSLASVYDAEVRVGDYPYCAWYTQKDFEEKNWEGYWFANKSDCPITIYVTDRKSATIQMFGFFHELGHVSDYHQRKEFKNDWDCEISAWLRGKQLMDENGIAYELKELAEEALACLSTYQRQDGDENDKFSFPEGTFLTETNLVV